MPLTPGETVNMRLMVPRTGITRFKMQYHDISKGLRIRSDNFHGYSHIDIELLGRLHPDVKNVHLESIEQDIKYKDPETHRSELLKLSKLIHN
jgi:hypothetical protein